MPDVRMPDGTIIRNVPEGTTKQQLMQKLGQAPQEATPVPEVAPETAQADPSFFEAFGRASVLRFLENMTAPAEMMGRALTPDPRRHGPIEAAAGLTKLVTGGAVDPAASAEANRQAITGSLSGENLAAASRFVGQMPPSIATGQPMQSFPALQAQEQEISRQTAEQAPVGTAIGEGAGDIATLLTARVPVRAAVRTAELAKIAPKVTHGAQTVVGRALQGFARSSLKAGGRAMETGLEGAFLASLQNGDVAQVAAQGAGAQVVGDMALATFRKFSQPKTLLTAVAMGTVASLGLQQLTPGGLNRVLPTFESRTKEAMIAFLLSGSATALTGGRIPKNFMGPAFAEIADVTRRGAMLSLLNSMSRDPAVTAPVVQKFTEDPDYFGPKAKQLLTRAINSEGIDVRNTVDRMMKDPVFQKKFDAIGTQ